MVLDELHDKNYRGPDSTLLHPCSSPIKLWYSTCNLLYSKHHENSTKSCGVPNKNLKYHHSFTILAVRKNFDCAVLGEFSLANFRIAYTMSLIQRKFVAERNTNVINRIGNISPKQYASHKRYVVGKISYSRTRVIAEMQTFSWPEDTKYYQIY